MSLRHPINLRLYRVKFAFFVGVFLVKNDPKMAFLVVPPDPPGWTLPRPYLRVVDSIPDNLGIFR